jgi:peptidoglycan-associated lipoprotein
MDRRALRRQVIGTIQTLAGGIALLFVSGCAKQPAATFEVVDPPPPIIQSIVHGAPDGARAGDSVPLTMKGDAGLTASATFAGLVADVPLAESSSNPGLYQGSILIPDGRKGTFRLTGRLQSEADKSSTLGGPSLRVLDPPPPPAPVLTAREFNAKKVLRSIYFEFDRHELNDESLGALSSNARWLREHPGFKLVIEGHCDERGTNEYNLALGDKRANATRSYLVDAGIQGSRLRTVSYGEERPVASERNERSWARNRRAEFVLED